MINYELLSRLAAKPHPLLHIPDDFEKQVREPPIAAWVAEVLKQARSAHHLLDLAGIPQRIIFDRDLDTRTWFAITKINNMDDRLYRIAAWHTRETAPGGMVGDFCISCDERWPCETRRMADGTHEDLQDEQ